MAHQRGFDNIDSAVRKKFKELAGFMVQLRDSKGWQLYEEYLIDYELNPHLRAVFAAKNENQRIESVGRVKQVQGDLMIPHLIIAIATEKNLSKSAFDIKSDLTKRMAWRYIPEGGSLFALFHNIGEENAKGEEDKGSVRSEGGESQS